MGFRGVLRANIRMKWASLGCGQPSDFAYISLALFIDSLAHSVIPVPYMQQALCFTQLFRRQIRSLSIGSF